MGTENLEAFFDLHEPVYLHQSYARNSQQHIQEFVDLDEARINNNFGANEWRTHFHIPIFLSENDNTTGLDLIEFLREIKKDSSLPILEIETYSFNALHNMYKVDLDVKNSITKELFWLKKQLEN